MDRPLFPEDVIRALNSLDPATDGPQPLELRYPPQASYQTDQPQYALFQPEKRKILQPVSVAKGGKAALNGSKTAAAPRAPGGPGQIEMLLGKKTGAVAASEGESQASNDQQSSRASAPRLKKVPVSIKKRLGEAQIDKAKETISSVDVAFVKRQSRANEGLKEEEESDDSDGGVPLPEESEDSDRVVALPQESEDSDSDVGVALPEESEDSDSDGGVALPEESEDSDSDGGVALPEDSEDSDGGVELS